MIVTAEPGKLLRLGRARESQARVVKFSIEEILASFPDAVISIVNRCPGDPDSYPVQPDHIEVMDNFLYWTVCAEDIPTEGVGQCQLVAREDDAIVKTMVFETLIGKAIDSEELPPKPWRGWIDAILEAAADAESAAKDAEAAVAEIEEISATAETLDPGEPATAEYTDGVLFFGIPQGIQGEQGIQGIQGERGPVGLTPDMTVGTVETGKPGSQAEVTITGTDENPVINMTIPRGDTGAKGDKGDKGDPGLESVLVGTQISGNQYRLGIERV